MASFNTSTAIVADDHELFRSALAEMLRRRFRFRAVIEADTFAALTVQLATMTEVAFACIDLAMPGMNGAESLRNVRAAYPNMRVAVITGSNERADILNALGAGVHGFIPKTLRIAEITEAVRTVLEGRIFVPAGLAVSLPETSPTPSMVPQSPAPMPDPQALSPRQADVLGLMAEGKSNKQIARELGVAEGTVKVHVAALFRAFGVHNRIGAITLMARLKSKPRNGNGHEA